jgi:hypothetical protein
MNKPQMSREEIIDVLSRAKINIKVEQIAIVGMRGYYRRSMGDPARNDRGIYDDALFIVSAGEDFESFRANTDPCEFRTGIATLKPGVYRAVKHLHHGKYRALQLVEDVVTRDGAAGEDRGRHGINFHYGGETATWSEGCQTLPKSSYWKFINLVYALMDKYGKRVIAYLLSEPGATGFFSTP